MMQDWAFVVSVEETNEMESRMHVTVLRPFSPALHFTNDYTSTEESHMFHKHMCSQLSLVHSVLYYLVYLFEVSNELNFSEHFKHHTSQNLDKQTKS